MKGSAQISHFHILDSLNDFVRPVNISEKPSVSSSDNGEIQSISADKVNKSRNKVRSKKSSRMKITKTLTTSKLSDGSKSINQFKILQEIGELTKLCFNRKGNHDNFFCLYK
jgi:hypothetical protein